MSALVYIAGSAGGGGNDIKWLEDGTSFSSTGLEGSAEMTTALSSLKDLFNGNVDGQFSTIYLNGICVGFKPQEAHLEGHRCRFHMW